MIEKIFTELGIESFLTGSHGIESDDCKISTEKSDYDYVLLIQYRHNLIDYLKERNIDIDYSCYNGGFKFTYEGKLYNVITAIYTEFMAWREALSIIKHLIKIDDKYKIVAKNKLSRYCLYEQLRALIKTTLLLGELQK